MKFNRWNFIRKTNRKNIMFPNRNRLLYFIMIITVIGFGLLSRKMAAYIPDTLDLVLGDSLWALMVYLIFGMLFSRGPIRKNAAGSAIFCFCIEFTQLYHAHWIDAIRSTRIGGLVLGYGFLISDLIAYMVGIGTGIAIDCLITAYKRRKA